MRNDRYDFTSIEAKWQKIWAEEDAFRTVEDDSKERVIADYIAGMTDHYAITVYSDMYIPKAWQI